jgi:Fe-S-cluster containining protein
MQLESKRKCGECTECCKGWLTANIHGRVMKPGLPCHFFGNKCTIYPQRPDTCRGFKCSWLDDSEYNIPEWIKPSLSKIIITTRVWGDDEEPYWSVVECGEEISPSVLNWLLIFTSNNNICVEYRIKGAIFHKGTAEFVQHMTGG